VKTIALSAVDGAGKSSTARAVEARIREEGRTVRTLHWPSDSLLGLLPDRSGRTARGLATLVGTDRFRSEAGRTPEIRGSRTHEIDASGWLARPRRAVFLTLLVVMFCLVVVNDRLMRPALARRYRGVDRVVLDRCALDDLVHLEYLGLPGGLVARGIARTDTDGIRLIDVPPEVAMGRDTGVDGPDHSDRYYEEKVALYRRYADRHDIRRLDGTDDVEELSRRIVREGE